MKALVISDDEEILEFVDNTLSRNEIDIINYKWLIKALDNVEEINPDLIVINVLDYPRHWKTLAQYARTIFTNKISICLFVPNGFSGEEMKKARALEIDFCCHSKEEFSKCIKNFMQANNDSLKRLKKIYSEKDDSKIISVTDLMQLLGKPLVNDGEDCKLISTIDLFNMLEGIAEPLEQFNPPKDSASAIATVQSAEKYNNDSDDDSKVAEPLSKKCETLESARVEAASNDFILPTVENLLDGVSSSGDYVLPSTKNLFEDFAEDAALPSTETLFEDKAEEVVLPTTKNLFDSDKAPSDGEPIASVENMDKEIKQVETEEKCNDCTLPTVENLLDGAFSGEDYVLPTTDNLFEGAETTSEASEKCAADGQEGISSENEIEKTEGIDNPVATTTMLEKNVATENDCTLPTVENLLDGASSSGDYVLPSTENLFEDFTEDIALPSTESLFTEEEDAVALPSVEGICEDCAQSSAECELPKTTEDSNEVIKTVETKRESDDCVLPSSEHIPEGLNGDCVLPTTKSIFEAEEPTSKGEGLGATEESNELAGTVVAEEETFSQNPIKNASEIPSDNEVEATNNFDPKSIGTTEEHSFAETDKNCNSASVSFDTSVSDDKNHFGSLLRLIQEKYEGQ